MAKMWPHLLKFDKSSNLVRFCLILISIIQISKANNITNETSTSPSNISSISTSTEQPSIPIPISISINMCCDLYINPYPFETTNNCEQNIYSMKNPPNNNTEQKKNLILPSIAMTHKQEFTFGLQVYRPNCSDGWILNNFTIDANTKMSDFQLQPDGYLKIGSHFYGSEYYNPQQYCLNGIKNYGSTTPGAQLEFQFATCIPPCTAKEPCIQKCCPLNMVITGNQSYWRCTEGLSGISPIKYEALSTNQTNTTSADIKKYKKQQILVTNAYYFIHNPTTWKSDCGSSLAFNFQQSPIETESTPLNENKSRTFLVLQNGRIMYKELRTNWIPLDYSCIDGYEDVGNSINMKVPVEKSIIFACHEPNQKDVPKQHHFYAIVSITCSIFALITALTYLILWKQQGIHGWVIASFSTTVFFLFLCLGVAHLISDAESGKKNSDVSANNYNCRIIALVCHFFFVSMFSWLAILSLDLWLSFRYVTEGDSRMKDLTRFIYYCVFGWGIPIITIICTLAFETKNSIPAQADSKAQKYDSTLNEHCFGSHKLMWEFVYGPCIMLFGCNFIFFILATNKLIEYKKCTEFNTNAIPNGKNYVLFVKLLIIITIICILQIISGILRGAKSTTNAITWQLFYTINCLEPLALFFIFVLKWDILNGLAEKSSILNCLLSPALWFLTLKKTQTRFSRSAAGGGTNYDSDDDLIIDESSPLSVSRPTYTHLPAPVEYVDDFVDESRSKL